MTIVIILLLISAFENPQGLLTIKTKTTDETRNNPSTLLTLGDPRRSHGRLGKQKVHSVLDKEEVDWLFSEFGHVTSAG